jgi:hypothetical protein
MARPSARLTVAWSSEAKTTRIFLWFSVYPQKGQDDSLFEPSMMRGLRQRAHSARPYIADTP